MFEKETMAKVHKARIASVVSDWQRAQYYGEMAAAMGANDFLPGMPLTPFTEKNDKINEELEKPCVVLSVNNVKTNTYGIKGYATQNEILDGFADKLKGKLEQLGGNVEVEADSMSSNTTAILPICFLTIDYVSYIGMFVGEIVTVNANQKKIEEILKDIFGVFQAPVEIIVLPME